MKYFKNLQMKIYKVMKRQVTKLLEKINIQQSNYADGPNPKFLEEKIAINLLME